MLAAKVLPEKILKLTLSHVLLALDFLHTEAGIVHTDIQEKNIMLGIEDNSILADFEEGEKSHPSPRKIVGERVIYSSRKLGRTKNHGRPVLCDFGQARVGSSTYCGDIQPYIYRAPEVVLRMPWDEKVDIWNLGVLTWDLFQKGHLFYARDSDKQNSDAHHLAEMIAILGPPPTDLLRNSDYAKEFFDNEAKIVSWVYAQDASMAAGGERIGERAFVRPLVEVTIVETDCFGIVYCGDSGPGGFASSYLLCQQPDAGTRPTIVYGWLNQCPIQPLNSDRGPGG
ncbi:hypothetical protein Asppvi_000146 [Aspergillus pseudoviridinutans]|uniref:Protein kinase domain-containing protein n=1 Tax=Aspergillus pseudoviridinutans TaxID=1517512 RepID=A0A9P3B1B5_9EURO|nr:uncharacterized protein Asppvi_000146 [Aspergillus pseudoviridinutans]GIJ81647.1 hypothetical protein Asppvi_000146 [Aspergillus pseudoviridinutans]